jgi:hypothetical protein
MTSRKQLDLFGPPVAKPDDTREVRYCSRCFRAIVTVHSKSGTRSEYIGAAGMCFQCSFPRKIR